MHGLYFICKGEIKDEVIVSSCVIERGGNLSRINMVFIGSPKNHTTLFPPEMSDWKQLTGMVPG